MSLQSKGLSRVFSNTTVQKHQFLGFFTVQLSHPYMTTGKTTALTRRTIVGKIMSLLLNMLSRLVITFLPRSKRLLISYRATERTTTCGISHPFGQLFPTSGQVAYALLSRSPLATRASPSHPFDLHVSCTPPALILSQDQTLRKKVRPH